MCFKHLVYLVANPQLGFERVQVVTAFLCGSNVVPVHTMFPQALLIAARSKSLCPTAYQHPTRKNRWIRLDFYAPSLNYRGVLVSMPGNGIVNQARFQVLLQLTFRTRTKFRAAFAQEPPVAQRWQVGTEIPLL